MANATADLVIEPYGKGGRDINMPMSDGETVFKGTMVAQDATDGGIARVGTANHGDVRGVAKHGAVGGAATGDERILIETDRVFVFNNAANPNNVEETLELYTQVFAEDDNTISDNDQGATLQAAGLYMGLEPDGRVRVYIGPAQ